jgi:integrase
MHQGEWDHPNKPVPFGKLAERWFEIDVKPRVAPNTLDAYSTWLRSHVLPHFCNVDARTIGSEDIQVFIAKKLTAGLAVGYIKLLVGQVKTILRQGVEWGYLRQGAADLRAHYPRVQKDEIDPFTPEELRALLDHAPPHWRPLLAMAVWTGMRQSELIAARWANLDENKASYWVSESMTRRMHFGNVKGANAASVDLSPYTMDALLEQRTRVSEWRLASSDWEDLDLIFPNSVTGRAWTHSYLRKVFMRICETAKVRYRPPHNLRHTCASLMLHQGDSLKVVQKQLRHANPQITLSTYIHLLPDERKQAAARLDTTILGASGHAASV